MVQIIGMMIGAYIFTRMLELGMTKSAHVAVRVVAILTLLLDVFLVFVLAVFTGQEPAIGRR